MISSKLTEDDIALQGSMLHFSASATGLIKRGNFAEARRVNDYLLTPTNHSRHVKESKTVLDYGFHPSEFQILNSGYFQFVS